MCVDFTNFNKACPKDPFPMPWIDQLVDCDGRPFSDEFFGCLSRISPNTISAGRSGKDSFCHSTGNYHYKVMPFGLKNVGSTY